MIEQCNEYGYFDIYINGLLKESKKNRVMNTVLSQMIGSFLGNTNDLEIKYIAFGSSSTPVSNTDSVLYNEVFRTPYATRTQTAYNEITTEFSVLSTESNGQIEEIGIFGGSTASITKDSGTLISRILWSHLKTSSEELAIKRIDKLERG